MQTTKTVCVTGGTGQTGSFLLEKLINKGYKVVFLKRRTSSLNTSRIDHLLNHPNLEMVYGDLLDSSSLINLVSTYKPDYFYHCAAMSDVGISYKIAEYSVAVNTTATVTLLEAIRKYSPNTKFLHTATSEMFGTTPPPHDETSIFAPTSPYAISKLAAYEMVKLYRSAYGLFCMNSISHNHDSAVRGENFMSRKTTIAATRIKLGLQDKLRLGRPEPRRDFSYAGDIADGLILALESDTAEEYLFSSDVSTSVGEFVNIVFDKLGLDVDKHVEWNTQDFIRPSEVPHLKGNSQKARTALGWKPTKNLDELIDLMIKSDLRLAENEKLILEQGSK